MKQTKAQKAADDALIVEAMRLLGKRTSDKKKVSSAANGRKGGRPVESSDPASILRREKYAQKKNGK